VDLRSKADVLLLKGGSEGEYRGWFRVLAENHFLFDVIRLDVALDRPWDQYKAVIVPEIMALSDALAEKLDAFAAEGGVVIAVGQTGFRDEKHNPRPELALKCLGIEEVLRVREEMSSSYFKVAPNLSGFRQTEGLHNLSGLVDLVYMDSPYIYARYAEDAQPQMRLIPPHNYGPPERCYYEQVTEHPGFVVHPFGQGKAIYLPWSPGALFHRQGYVNTAWFCADLLQTVAGLTPLGGNLAPQVEATLFEKGDGSYLLLHLVNGSGHFGTTFYPPVTMTDVEVVAPCAKEPVSVRGLRSGQSLTYTWNQGALTISVPKLDLFEAVKIVYG